MKNQETRTASTDLSRTVADWLSEQLATLEIGLILLWERELDLRRMNGLMSFWL